MSRRPIASAVPVLLLTLAALGCRAGADPEIAAQAEAALLPAAGVSDADVAPLATRIVSQSAGIGAGDKVLISGTVRDAALLEELAVQVRRLGGQPLVVLESESLTRRLVTDVPETFDTQPRNLELELVRVFDAWVSVEAGETEGMWADIPPERLARLGQTFLPVQEAVRKRNARAINIGNELYPTAAHAERYGVSVDELRAIFNAGLDADYPALQARADALRQRVASGRELHITDANGTDLRVRIEGRKAYASDGVIDAAERAAGGAALNVWLPAGEVYVTPVPGTAEGTVIIDRLRYEGEWVDALRLEFRNGRIVAMSAGGPMDRLEAVYAAAGAGKDELGAIDIGLNPNVRFPASATGDGSWVAEGNVGVLIGNNIWAGGDNGAAFAFAGHLRNATVTLDGTPIVQGGRLQ